MTDDLMERIEGCIANAEHDDEMETLIDARDHIEALTAENERLNQLINDTGDYWLALQVNHPIQWEGAIDAAMAAACAEIERLKIEADAACEAAHLARAALGDTQ